VLAIRFVALEGNDVSCVDPDELVFASALQLHHRNFPHGDVTDSSSSFAPPTSTSIFSAFGSRLSGYLEPVPDKKGSEMGILDKITGRAKKAAGDLTDDASLRRQGKREERKGEKKEELDRAQEKADEKAAEVADLERKT